MLVKEFADNLQVLVDKAKEAGVPLQEIIDELEDLKASIEDEKEEKEETEGDKEEDD